MAAATALSVGCAYPERSRNPRLAGQHLDYVVKQLGVFQRTDGRPDGAVMKVVAHGLSAQDVIDVAPYLQALPKL